MVVVVFGCCVGAVWPSLLRPGGPGRRVGGSGGLEFFHLFGEGPEGAVDGGVLVDAADLAGLAAGDAAALVIALDVAEAAADKALLDGVERVPDGGGGVVVPAEGEDLLGGDGGGLVVVTGDQGGGGEGAALALGEAQGGHLGDAIIDLGEAVHDLDAAIDDVAGDVAAFVGDADVLKHGLGDDHAIPTDKAEDAGHEAVGAGAIVRVDQHDLVVVAADLGELAIVAEAQEVLGEAALVVVTAAALHDGVGAKALAHEAAKDLAGGDVAVAGAAAAVGLLGEDAGGDAAELVELNGGAAGVVDGSIAAGAGELANGGVIHGVVVFGCCVVFGLLGCGELSVAATAKV